MSTVIEEPVKEEPAKEGSKPSFVDINLKDIKPSKTNQRQNFDQEKIKELAESIRSKGVVQPILVRPVNGYFKSGDLCTDRTCFEKKREIFWQKISEEAEKRGQKVIDDSKAGNIFPHYYNGNMSHNTPFIKLVDTCELDPNRRKWHKLLGNHAPAPTLVRDSEGRIHEVITKDAANKALKEAGHEFKIGLGGYIKSASEVAKEKTVRGEALIQGQTVNEAIDQIIAKAEAAPADPKELPFWKLLTQSIIYYTWHNTIRDTVHRRGIEKKKGENVSDILKKQAGGMTLPQLKALVVELTACRDAKGGFSDKYGKHFKQACALYGVDLPAIEQKIKTERKAAAKAKEEKAAKKPAKKMTANKKK